ncbi:6587_t:CDS:2, partial [Funneliformis geosporum]
VVSSSSSESSNSDNSYKKPLKKRPNEKKKIIDTINEPNEPEHLKALIKRIFKDKLKEQDCNNYTDDVNDSDSTKYNDKEQSANQYNTWEDQDDYVVSNIVITNSNEKDKNYHHNSKKNKHKFRSCQVTSESDISKGNHKFRSHQATPESDISDSDSSSSSSEQESI